MLITCPDCKKQISSLAVACPNCGHPGPFAQENIADRAIAPVSNESAPDKPMADMPTGGEWDKKTLLSNLRRIYFARFMTVANICAIAFVFFTLIENVAPLSFSISVASIAGLIAIYFTSRTVVISTHEKSEERFKVMFAAQTLVVAALIIIACVNRTENGSSHGLEVLIILGGLFFAIALLSYALAWICAAVRIKSPVLLSRVRKRKSAPGKAGKRKTLEIISMSIASLLIVFGIWWFFVYLSPDDLYRKGQSSYMSGEYQEALRFFEMAAERGETYHSPYWLGKMYQEGNGVAQNREKALEWFRKSTNERAEEAIREIEAEQRRTEGCYLTTAAVGVVGLPDDCWELTTLRAFRDEVLAKTNQGRALIADYYALAPRIVAAIDRRPDAQRIWRNTWGLGIVPAALCAHFGLNRFAVHLYKSMTRRLQRLAGM